MNNFTDVVPGSGGFLVYQRVTAKSSPMKGDPECSACELLVECDKGRRQCRYFHF